MNYIINILVLMQIDKYQAKILMEICKKNLIYQRNF